MTAGAEASGVGLQASGERRQDELHPDTLAPDARRLTPDASYQPDLEVALRDDPTSFGFFQAVRVLERLFPGRAPVGSFANPADEIAHFTANPSVAFPASEIQSLEMREGAPAIVTVNIMGLTGPLGVLPLNYSMHGLERTRARDYAFRDFLDLFHHRILSLFYRAWEKYHFVIAHERDQQDRVTRHLHDLVGVGTPGLQNRVAVDDESLLFYSGLLGLPTRPAVALEQLVADYFGVPVRVEQFVGGWYPLERATQCSVGDDVDASGQLGLGAVAGDEIWDQQSRVRVCLGPLTRRQYEQFLPDGDAYESLRAFTSFFGGGQLDFEVQLVLARDEVPECVLGADASTLPLGWLTWMKTKPFSRDPSETILTL